MTLAASARPGLVDTRPKLGLVGAACARAGRGLVVKGGHRSERIEGGPPAGGRVGWKRVACVHVLRAVDGYAQVLLPPF